MASSSSGNSSVETGFELPRELERTLHERVLCTARERQRAAFRPGVTATGKAADIVLQERTAKKIGKALKALQDDYGFDAHEPALQRMAREALQYTNKLEDALQFLALQYSSDELPPSLRAAPTGALHASRAGDDSEDGALAVAVRANPVEGDALDPDESTQDTSHDAAAAAPPTATVADSWDDLAEDDGSVTPALETATAADASDVASVDATSESKVTALSWTQQYLQVIAQREEEEARAAAAFAKLSPEEKYVLELEAQFKHMLTVVAQAKTDKVSKKKQKALGLELQQLRQRLSERGWSEQEFYARERSAASDSGDAGEADAASDAAGTGQKSRRSKKPATQHAAQADTAGDASAATEPKALVDDEDEEDESAGGASLFDDPAPGAAVSSALSHLDADVSAPSSEPQTSAKSRGGKKKKAPPPQSWTGKSPRDHIQDHCKKHKLPKPVYKKLAARGRSHLYALVLDFKTHKREFVVPDGDGSASATGFQSIDEAKDTVATHALYAINPSLPLYRVLPPTYRDLWLTWVHAQEREAADAASHSRAGFDAIVREIVDTIPAEVRATVSTAVVAKATTESESKERPVVAATAVHTSDDEPSAAASSVLDNWALDDWDADLSDAEEAPTEEPVDDWEQEFATATQARVTAVPEPSDDPATRAYSQQLKTQLLASMQSKAYKALWTRRQDLPITAFKDTVLSALATHDVILISGETGCGKSTQVPQFLLEHALLTQERGATCHIVCTQPRRLAAISLAERVSQELGEPAMGSGDSLCGFQIRLENRMTAHTRLVFCTTGILLRRLQDPATLAGVVSHIIVDEVHERDLQNDVLLSMLRQFLASANRSRATPLKVILMSATLNAASFQRYFGGESACPMLSVPGRTFPVQEQFLEDVLELTEYVIDDTHPAYVPYERVQQSAQLKVSGRGGTSFSKTVYWDAAAPVKARPSASSAVSAVERDAGESSYSARTLKMLDCIDASVINYELIQDLLERLVIESELLALSDARPSASVLIFLPGLHEISTLLDLLGAHRVFADERKFALLPLHSSLAPQDQQRIFAMPRGIVRIIATTNIAETSLTVEDVKVVIDSGRVKEMRHNSTQRTNVLDEIWISRANAKQRMGRAGRTSGGVCYRLFPRAIYAATMDEQPVPEIQRAPLTSLCLQIKTFGVGVSCSEFLGACLDPPDHASVRDALHELFEIGALERTDETLTTLGRNLARLPVDVKVGKMLLLGALFDVFDPIATSAAILETKSPFVAPFGHQSAMQAARKLFAVGQSDLLTDVNAYEAWRAQFGRGRSSGSGSSRAEREFCRQHYLSHRALVEITKLKQQFYTLVAQAGYLPARAPSATDRGLSREQTALATAILFAGLAPNLVHIERAAASDASKKRYVLRDQDHTLVVVHPSSINHKTVPLASAFLTYAVKLHTSQIYLPTSSLVLPAAICLFSHALEIVPQTRSTTSTSVTVRVNDWVVFQSSLRSAIVLQELRAMVVAFIARKMETPLAHRHDSSAASASSALAPPPPPQQAQDDALLKHAVQSLLAAEYDLHDPKQALTKQLSSVRKDPIR